MTNATDNSFEVLKAELNDIPLLTGHHCAMFQEIWSRKGQPLDRDQLADLGEAYTRKLNEQMPAGVCRAWIIKLGEEVASSGAVTVCSFVPTPIDSSHNLVYFHSVYTEKDFRGRGCAQLLVDQAIQYCRSIRLKRIILTASEAGRPIYAKLGFEPASDLMRLIIP